MPLGAQVDGVRTVSLALNDQEWTALKAAVRAGRAALLLFCGMPGHPKTSPLGTQFFAHDPRAGCGGHGPESAAHLLAKQQIVEAARASGWSAELEVAGDGWIADILAERGSARVAFEVQWSRQTAEEYRTRQQRYVDAGIRGAWFVRHKTSVPTTPDDHLPAFLLKADGNAMTVDVEPTTMPLAEVVTRLLTKRIGFRAHVSAGQPSTVVVRYHREDCYQCGSASLFWEVGNETITGPCGNAVSHHQHTDIFPQDRPEAAPTVRLAGQSVATSTGIRLALLQPRHTKASGTKYMAFCCPRCGATFGEFFLRERLRELWSDAEYDGVASLETDGAHQGLPHPHWCVDSGEGLCALPPPGTAPTAESKEGIVPEIDVVRVGNGPGEIPVRQALRRLFGRY